MEEEDGTCWMGRRTGRCEYCCCGGEGTGVMREYVGDGKVELVRPLYKLVR